MTKGRANGIEFEAKGSAGDYDAVLRIGDRVIAEGFSSVSEKDAFKNAVGFLRNSLNFTYQAIAQKKKVSNGED